MECRRDELRESLGLTRKVIAAIIADDGDTVPGVASRLVARYRDLRDRTETTQKAIKAECDEARESLRRCHNEYIEVSHDREAKMETLQSSHDAAWRRYNETDAAYQAALDENQALRAALRVAAGQRDGKPCHECGLDSAHFDDCRHHATESKVMQ
jgi:hypothetical protein